MRSSPRTVGAVPWHAKATYYFDAAWQTSQTLRHLMHASLADEPLGLHKPPELLMQTMESMLNSICPGLPDDADSLDCFQKRLQMHLSELTASELSQLQQLLNSRPAGDTVRPARTLQHHTGRAGRRSERARTCDGHRGENRYGGGRSSASACQQCDLSGGSADG
jgi:hypothetical protein